MDKKAAKVSSSASQENLPALKKRLREAELLLAVGKKISATDTLNQVLDELIALTVSEMGAERGSLFLNDPVTNELYSRVAQETKLQEIRFLNSTGVAGYVFNSGKGVMVHDAYSDPRFNRSVDEQTGFVTRSILCVPVRTARGEVIGVAQALNKINGKFTTRDLALFEAMVGQGALALQSAQFIERLEQVRQQELQFINVVSEMTSDIKLGSLLQKVMGEATRMLNAERSTLFLHDEKTGELWSEVGQGLDSMQIRLPSTVGIAGAVFESGKTINIPHAYADLRFNPEFDRRTGFFTRSILCVPVVNKHGRIIGVTQVLNKRGGPFNQEDEVRLRAFTAQVSIALENAKLFADVQSMKNYNEAMLESMSNGVVTMDESCRIATCNAACLRILGMEARDVLMRHAAEVLTGPNTWVVETLQQVEQSGEQVTMVDATIERKGEKISVNVTVQPLLNMDHKRIGSMMVIEDISREKRLKATMSRMMDPRVADQMVATGAELLAGQNVEATVLFSDIRGFTTLTEQLGAQGTVSLLNEYFALMVDCIDKEQGMVDKFIGDAIMAGFGTPLPHEDDADRAVRTAIAMIKTLEKWNQQRASDGKPPVSIGIGLNTDTVVVGNIGTSKRVDFTIIGDGVNLASRLESACKQYGAKILVSEFTVYKLSGTYRKREIDRVVVKGKTEPVGVYEILAYHTPESFPNIVEVLGLFKDALTAYRSKRWDNAIKLFQDCLALNPDDKPSKIYIERTQHLKLNPPPDDWNGVWVMDSK